MKILFLNVWNGRQTQGLRDFLAQHTPDTDIFCLQEATGSFDSLHSELLSGYTPAVLHKLQQNGDSYCLSTNTRKPLEAAEAVSLWKDPSLGAALYTTFPLAETTLHLVNVHGIPNPGKRDTPERIQQSTLILDFLKDKSGIKIIGGDFNIMPDTDSVQTFRTAGFHDLIQEYDIKTTRNRFAWERYPGNELMYSDYVFLQGDVRVVEFAVPSLEISDHLPMILTLDLAA
jgi:endonuclease/exonuclease/phosphatase family metal-dependent hydrolase